MVVTGGVIECASGIVITVCEVWWSTVKCGVVQCDGMWWCVVECTGVWWCVLEAGGGVGIMWGVVESDGV